MSACKVGGCPKPQRTRGWCNAHYLRWLRHGDPLHGGPRRVRGEDIADRIARCLILGPDCWEWRGYHDRYGYAWARTHPPKLMAHRAVYEFVRGPIPERKELDHLCENTGCVRPAHLEPVTHRENVLRGKGPSAAAARKTHCPQGHPYDEANTYWTRAGTRQCRTCQRKAAPCPS
ncbi:MAG: HNH endonuclease [Actinomycetota bacterium]|nr:HNH endonuclease [Actinomycetota bacterium]